MITRIGMVVFTASVMAVSSLTASYVVKKKMEATSIQVPMDLKAACEADQRGCVVAPADQIEEVINNMTEKAFAEGKVECNKGT
jgi:hypothetical protein